jgi:hypothetical protein
MVSMFTSRRAAQHTTGPSLRLAGLCLFLLRKVARSAPATRHQPRVRSGSG